MGVSLQIFVFLIFWFFMSLLAASFLPLVYFCIPNNNSVKERTRNKSLTRKRIFRQVQFFKPLWELTEIHCARKGVFFF